ncbi:MAG: hypothetical protein A2Z91_07045 [Deltaproteobacteria bacterium GWA2_38_16]|nr:MAG: hypothetical protein A2Z91_07045 [Deltaproteobacteria bacterium GWA2_38_16]OGQ02372.1 MAG: hypothetical protein A3D19_05980 [Deltaproteobacteria bacterium RIFCSPHIGHO2_02_FULL_38_15]OGQ34449.1 MAG: hypothetical protein A3A72_01060 [Deltaproteobacteria bacterium RIFCSPLOWO2_01_FULL_38_9]OGQ60443.1 MAG: hypothetical protein A3G92_07210 [Deltaproteobacteria bacterium RIFCSPLOWO2_12_FULL_38_8]HBQ20707.1 NADH-quinone oxidoreductase subunit A [Deltaproteobacteria bacterium]
MYTQFTTILLFLIIGACMVPLILLVGRYLRPANPDPKKLSTYECGELPKGNSWVQFNLRFYVIAILFLIFDVEIAFMFPVAVTFRQWVTSSQAKGVLIFSEIILFIAILLIGFVYAWTKGDFEWIKGLQKKQIDPRFRGDDLK